jgi:PKD repeat protein
LGKKGIIVYLYRIKVIVTFFLLFLLIPFTAFAITETIQYIYNSTGELIKEMYNVNNVTVYLYDNMGNRLSKTVSTTGDPANNPPNQVSTPSPADGSTDVPTILTLSWAGGDDPDEDHVVYYVYLGTTTYPSLIGSTVQASFTIPYRLESYITYYWRVDVRDSNNMLTTGPLWSFTTGNTLPAASFTVSPTDGWAPLTVQFTDTSTSPDGDEIVSWEWDFDNDGTVDSTLQNPVYIYDNDGKYTVSLTVVDIHGGSDTEVKEQLISVCSEEGSPPVANSGGPYLGQEGNQIIFDASNSIGSNGWRITYYEWDATACNSADKRQEGALLGDRENFRRNSSAI